MSRKNLKDLEDLSDKEGPGVKRWEIRFWHPDPTRVGTPSRLCKRRFIGTVTQAQLERDHLKHYLRRGLDPDGYPRPHVQSEEPPKRITRGQTDFGTLAKNYEAHRDAADIRAATRAGEKKIMEDRIIPAIGDWVVEMTTPNRLDDLRLKWKKDHVDTGKYSAATVNHWIRVLKSFVKWASLRVNIMDPSRGLSQLPKPPKRGRALSRVESQAFFAKLKELYPQYHAMAYLACYSGGQRWQSISALRWQDVDEDAGTITFRLSQYRGVIREGAKDGQVTVVPLEPFKGVLEAHKAWLDQNRKHHDASDWVFPAKGNPKDLAGSGLIIFPSSVNKALKRVCEKLEIPPISFHDLRRTFTSQALAGGAGTQMVQALSGHSDQMTGHYHHVQMDGVTKMIEGVIGKKAETPEDIEAYRQRRIEELQAELAKLRGEG